MVQRRLPQLTALITALAVSACVFSGCADYFGKREPDPRPLVFASFYAVGELVKLAGGDNINLQLIVSGGEPHDWEPSPKDVTKIAGASAVFYNGLGLEGFIDELRAAAPDTRFVCLNDGVTAEDPHSWLEPASAARQLGVIAEALGLPAPNGDVLRPAFEAAERLRSFEGRSFVVTHAAFGWLEAYGVKQYALTSAFDEDEPTPAKVAECIDFIKANDISVIFCEEGGESKVADAIAKEAGIKTAKLNTMEYDTGAGGYVDIMTANLEAILASFASD